MTCCTTLARIRAKSPCESGWKKLRKFLGPDFGMDAPLPFATIVESNGMDDALWCCRSVAYDRVWRLYAVWCARQVQHLTKDQRSLNALDVAQAFASGIATREQLESVRAAAWESARDAVRTASWAARAAAGAASWAASWAARAASGAARAAAWGASGDAGAARAAQKAMFLRVVNAPTEDAAVALLLDAMPKEMP